jgi:hypothetical protein
MAEEFLKWRLILNEQMKSNGYTAIYDMVMNLEQAMFAGRSLEAFLTERRSQEAINRIRKAKDQTMHTPNQIYDCARQFVLLTSKVDGEMPMRGRENI